MGVGVGADDGVHRRLEAVGLVRGAGRLAERVVAAVVGAVVGRGSVEERRQ